MNTEETKILNPQTKSVKEGSKANKEKKTSTGSKIGYTAGGFAVGAMSGAGISAYASTNETPVTEESTEAQQEELTTSSTPENAQETPQSEDILLATDEGVKVAQVSDDVSFNEAFADARAQVGPGGVFEWHGRVYGTYYKEE